MLRAKISRFVEFSSMITSLVNDVFIPITAGGGIRNMSDAQLLFNSGADKILVNTRSSR